MILKAVCPPAGVLVVSQLCFGGRWHLGGVFRWCFGGIQETVVSWSKMVPRTIPNWRQRRCETLLLDCMLG